MSGPLPRAARAVPRVAAHARRHYDLDLDPDSEVLITSGATEALLDCFLGLLEAGDEVVLLEPAYDTYAPVLRRLGVVKVTNWWALVIGRSIAAGAVT